MYVKITMAIVISICSILAVMLCVGTKVANAPTVAETHAASYDDTVIWGMIVMGLLMMFVAIWTYKLHVIAGIIPFGVGASALGYGLYVAYCKWMLPV